MHASYCYRLREAKVELRWYSFLSLAAIILLYADKVSSLVITPLNKKNDSGILT